MSERTILRRFSYRHEAEIVRSALEGIGIDAVITSDDCGSVDPALGLVRGACVAVFVDDVERAEEMLAAALPAVSDTEDGDGPA